MQELVLFLDAVSWTISVKVNNDYQNNENNNLLLLDTIPFSIKSCSFDPSKGGKCAIFYTRGNHGSSFELIDCSFNGISDSNSNYIMRTSISKNSPKIEVRRSKFDTNPVTSFDISKNKDFLIVDLKSNNIFHNFMKIENEWFKYILKFCFYCYWFWGIDIDRIELHPEKTIFPIIFFDDWIVNSFKVNFNLFQLIELMNQLLLY